MSSCCARKTALRRSNSSKLVRAVVSPLPVFWPLFALFIVTLFGLFWFAVRMMLFAGATVIRSNVHVFRSWAWTKGHFRVLAPLMLVLIIVPLVALSAAAIQFNEILIGTAETSAKAGMSAGLTAFFLLPSAWLGHGFASSVLARLMPDEAG